MRVLVSLVIGPITPKPKYTKVLPPGVPEAVNNSITYLKWEPPKHNGGCKITDYLVEERFKGAEMWCKCNEYPCTDPSLLSPIFLRTQSGSLELQLLTLLETVSPVCAHQHTKSRRRLDEESHQSFVNESSSHDVVNENEF
ncbi:titin-like [Saccostrea echinata]|uniref:titin-like n=1 Tax=Saccostrea echinata TaxID=191078 RepID=UPI002A83BD5E|nr:titin-like [Saccostrea echinata]